MKIMFLLLLPASLFGQLLCKGLIINKETKKGVAFATIGLIIQNIGTNADEDGRFSFDNVFQTADTLLISSIGYEALKVAFDRQNSNATFELQPKVTILKEVIVVGNSTWKQITLGQYANCGNNHYTVSNTINQVVRHFTAPVERAYLKEVEICKYGITIIDPARAKFRVRIYTMDNLTKAPYSNLCDSIIELDVTGRHIKVNLENYNIILPDKDFFVGIEWLRIKMNKNKNKANFGGQKKVVYYTYSPLLAFKEIKDDNTARESWQLDYTGKWIPFGWDAMISATVKY